MKARFTLLALAGLTLAGCGGSTPAASSIPSTPAASSEASQATSIPSVSWDNPYADIADETATLMVWAGESQDSIDFVKHAAAEFKKANPRSNYTIQTKAVSEAKAFGEWQKDPNTAADVAIVADDQLPSMISSNYIQNVDAFSSKVIPGIKENLRARNDEDSMNAVIVNDKAYGFPVSSSNSYILYYKTDVIQDTAVDSFESLLAAIKAASDDSHAYRFGFPYQSGWYLDGWMHAAGCTATGAPGGNIDSNWSGAQALDAARALVKLAHGQYEAQWYSDMANTIMTQVGEGPSQIVATISGTWSYKALQKAWNGHVGATILPKYHLDAANQDVRMQAPQGYKIAVVNAKSQQIKPAAKFAEFLTNYAMQIARFDLVSEAPTNTAASHDVDLDSNACVKAVFEQYEENAFIEKVNEFFWNPSDSLATQLCGASTKQGQTNLIASGKGTAEIVTDDTEIQNALNECVASFESHEK